jgi:N-methylhydantoinase A
VRTAWFDGVAVETPIFRGDQLRPGNVVAGPAIIEEPTTTLVIIPGARALARATHYLVEIGDTPEA